MVTMVPGRVGGFSRCAPPNIISESSGLWWNDFSGFGPLSHEDQVPLLLIQTCYVRSPRAGLNPAHGTK